MKYLFFLLIATLSISSYAATPSDQLTEKVLILSGQENVEDFEFFSDFLFRGCLQSKLLSIFEFFRSNFETPFEGLYQHSYITLQMGFQNWPK